jgi:hypothetical protein
MSLWLTHEELVELTGYKRRELQRRALAEMSIQFRSRPHDGFPLVERAQFETLTKGARRREPNFTAIGRA